MIEEFSLDLYIFFKSFKTNKMDQFLDGADPFYQELLFLEKLLEKSLVSCIIPNNLSYYNNREKISTSCIINLINISTYNSKNRYVFDMGDGNSHILYESLYVFRKKEFAQDYIIQIEYGSDVFKYLVKSKSKNNKGILYEPI